MYAIKNCIIYEQLMGFTSSGIDFVFLLLIIFIPYRLHLAAHVLEIAFLIAFLVSSIIGIGPFILPAILASVRSVFCYPSFFGHRGAIVYLLVLLASLMLFDGLRSWVQAMASNDFRFRSNDSVLIFSDIGNVSITRTVTWLLLFLTGGLYSYCQVC